MAEATVVRLPVVQTSERGTNAREKILEVAEQLIVQYGSNGFSYRHISDAIGIRKASIHHHFPTKVDLILELGEIKAGSFFTRMNQIMVSKASALEKLDRYFGLFEENFIHGCGASVSFFGMLGAEIESQDDRVASGVRNFFRENISRLSAMIAEGMEEGTLRRTGNPEVMAAAIFSMLEGAMIIVRAGGDVSQYSQIIAHILQLITADDGTP